MNNIHTTAIIDERVKLGDNNTILPYTIIYGPTDIGNNNIIGPHVVIGTPGQDTRNPTYNSKDKKIIIGDNNIIREFTAIQKPCYEDLTYIGNNVYLMQSVHIPHDARISDNVVITPMVSLAGITRILKAANIGMGATVAQYLIIGQYSIVATGAAAVKNVKPFSKFIPNKMVSVNDYAIDKFGFEEYKEEIYQYVLNDIQPKSQKIRNIIDEYQILHTNSGKGQY